MPSIGKDLATIRDHLGLTIQDIQYATKIPVSTLKTIENDSIFSKKEEGTTYIRSFVRSYGRALRMDDDTMIKALDQYETGNYNNLLLQQFDALSAGKAEKSETDQQADASVSESNVQHGDLFSSENSDTEKSPQDSEPVSESYESKPEKEEPAEKPKAEKPASKPGDSVSGPSVKSVDWAKMGKRYTADKKRASAWVISLIILLMIVAGTVLVLYHFGYFDVDNQSQETITTPENQPINSELFLNMEEPDVNEEGEYADITYLEDILHITIYAAYGPLDPVRVWSDMKPRLDPYWLEQSVALEFEFRDTVRIRGNYANVLLFKSGHLIENAYEEYFDENENVIEITRDLFTSDPKWASPVSYELPEGVAEPDSIAPRPRF